MKARIITGTVAAAAAIALGSSATAQAAVTPRLVGTWNVETTVLRHDQFPGDVGAKAVRKWVLTPTCAAGACATTLKRTRVSNNTVVTTTLNPATGTSQYRGVATYSSECFNADGSVRVVKGYNTTETTVINVTTKDAQGVTTAFTGTLSIRFAPTAAGKAAGCRADFIGDSFKSVKRTA